MNKLTSSILSLGILTLSPFSALCAPIHGVVDVSHDFSFYGDGRFAKQYLDHTKGHKGASNWGDLHRLDLKNTNLLVLLGCYPKMAYSQKDFSVIQNFLNEGGCVLMLGNAGKNPQNDFISKFGATFSGKASTPFKAAESLPADSKIEGNNFSTLTLDPKGNWKPLVLDNSGKPVAAISSYGKGKIIVASRNLIGNRPDAKDNVNASWWPQILESAVAAKPIDSNAPLKSNGFKAMGNSKKIGNLNYIYTDYLEHLVEKMAAIESKCRPEIQKVMGVPLAPGMASTIGLLATDGGGFSGGRDIGLAVYWGDFPQREDNMIEFLTHESTHSWVLPHPEVWNEPIATYVGNLVMESLDHKTEAQKRISDTINRALRHDPEMKLYDINGNSAPNSGAKELNNGQKNDIHWGKTYWVFEELRKQDPQFLAKYFQTKRKYVPNSLSKRYSMDDTVAVLSKALNKDLFPWFNEHGMNVDKSRSTITFENK